MQTHRISLKDVAQKVGVSMVTVSAAINGNGRVGKQLALKIRQVAQEMGYQPNAAAQILKNSPKDLGLLILEQTELIRSNAGIQNAMVQFMQLSREKNRRCHLEWFDPTRHPEELPRMLTDGLVGGVVCYGYAGESISNFMEKSLTFPIVRLDEPAKYNVCSDMFEGIRRTVHELAGYGHRNIGMINGLHFEVFQRAKNGFETAMRELGLMTGRPLCYLENKPYDNYPREVNELADRILALGADRPTVLLIDGGPLAKAFISVLQQRGIRVPDDISIVSFSCVDWETKSFIPSVTALDYSFEKTIFAAVNMLLDLMDHKEPAERNILIPPQLTIRESLKMLNNK